MLAEISASLAMILSLLFKILSAFAMTFEASSLMLNLLVEILALFATVLAVLDLIALAF